jgi:hypothetical protein
MTSRDIALAFIRSEVEESGELTVFALRVAQEHRIGYAAMMVAAREGLRRRARRASPTSLSASEPKEILASLPATTMSEHNPDAEAKDGVSAGTSDVDRDGRDREQPSPAGASASDTYAPETPSVNKRPRRVPRRLPIVTIDGKRYFRDDRLREYRAVDDPHERRPL